MPKISIIVPVYNAEQYIEKCILTLTKQTYADIDIILVDDGSSDKSKDICDRWAATDSRINVIHKPNGGVSSARNAGLDIVNSEYVTFVDADDYVSEDYVSTLYNGIIKDNADLFIGSYKEVGTVSEKLHTTQSGTYSLSDGEMFAEAISRADLMNTIVPKLFRTELIGKLRFDTDIKYAEDTFFVFSYLAVCDKISFGSSAEYFYNKKMNDNASQKLFAKRDEYVYKAFLVYKDAIERIKLSEEKKALFVAKRSFQVFYNTVDYYSKLRFGKYFTKERFLGIYQNFSPYFNYEVLDDIFKTKNVDLIYKKMKLSFASHILMWVKRKLRAVYINFKK